MTAIYSAFQKKPESGTVKDCTDPAPEQQATLRYKILDPTHPLSKLTPGSVLISKSGNVRLVLHRNQNFGLGEHFVFLTRTNSGELKIENTLSRKVDQSKLKSIIGLISHDPLNKYAAVIKHLGGYPDIMHNCAVLLGCGQLGAELRSDLYGMNDQKSATIKHFGIDFDSGKIEAVSDLSLLANLFPIGFEFNPQPAKRKDYVSRILFYGEMKTGLKKNVLIAVVLANLLQNAQNFAGYELSRQDTI